MNEIAKIDLVLGSITLLLDLMSPESLEKCQKYFDVVEKKYPYGETIADNFVRYKNIEKEINAWLFNESNLVRFVPDRNVYQVI